MTVLATGMETSTTKAQNAGAFGAKCSSSFGRVSAGWAAIGGLGLAVAAWLKGRADAGPKAMLKVGGGGGNRPLTGVGSGFPPKIPQKIFGDLPHWRLF